MIRTPLPLAILVAAALHFAPAAHAAPTYRLTDVGNVAGCDRAAPGGLNDQGDMTGTCYNGSRGLGRAFAYRGGTMTLVGLLPAGTWSEGAAINGSGAIAGHGDSDKAPMLGFATTSAGLQVYFSNNGGYTRSMFIGNTGFVGGRYTTSKSGWVAKVTGAIWTPDPKDPRKYRRIDLPFYPGGIDPKSAYSHPSAFNHAGQAAGYATNDEIGMRAAFWNNDAAHSIELLPRLYDGALAEALGMNGLGQVVGVDGERPVMWANDATRTVSELPLLPGDIYGKATGINDAGEAIGMSGWRITEQDGSAQESSVVWTDGGVHDIHDLLDAATSQGYTIASLVAINGRGQIAAQAILNGVPRAVLLTPVR